jgi:hypothetical protein
MLIRESITPYSEVSEQDAAIIAPGPQRIALRETSSPEHIRNGSAATISNLLGERAIIIG